MPLSPSGDACKAGVCTVLLTVCSFGPNLLAIKKFQKLATEKRGAPGFLSVFLWNGAQCRHMMMPKMRSVDTIGIDTKAALALKKHFS